MLGSPSQMGLDSGEAVMALTPPQAETVPQVQLLGFF